VESVGTSAAPESVKMEHAALDNVQITKHVTVDLRLVEHPIAFVSATQLALASVASTQSVLVLQLAILTKTARMVAFVLRIHAVSHHLMISLESVF